MAVMGMACTLPAVHIQVIPLVAEIMWSVVGGGSIVLLICYVHVWTRVFWYGGEGFMHCSSWQRSVKALFYCFLVGKMFCFVCMGNCVFVQLEDLGWNMAVVLDKNFLNSQSLCSLFNYLLVLVVYVWFNTISIGCFLFGWFVRLTKFVSIKIGKI